MNQDYFFSFFAPMVSTAVKRAGYGFTSAILAQMANESGWAESALAKQHYNYFGMKAGADWTGKTVSYETGEHTSSGEYYRTTATFRSYDSPADGISGYFEFLKYPRYANLKNARTPEEYIEMIAADGWATSPTYANSLKRILNDYSLKRYDSDTKQRSIVLVDYLRKRVYPSVEASTLKGYLMEGDQVDVRLTAVVDDGNRWALIRAADGSYFWCAAEYNGEHYISVILDK